MSVNSEAFLLEAERLLQDIKCEATSRTIVSRAYYGAFHLADAWHRSLPEPGISLPKCGDHKSFLNQLAFPTVKDETLATKSKNLCLQLKSLYYMRIKADYTLDQDVSEKEAANAAAKSRVIHELFL